MLLIKLRHLLLRFFFRHVQFETLLRRQSLILAGERNCQMAANVAGVQSKTQMRIARYRELKPPRSSADPRAPENELH